MSVDRSALPALGADRPFGFPRQGSLVLPCGLAIRTIEHHDVPVLALLLIIRAGSADDPDDRPGLAALTADLLDEGVGELSALDIHEAIARLGAQFDTETGYDTTVVTLVTLARFRDPALDLLADIVFAPAMRDTDVDRVRELRVNRLRQLRESPGALAEEAFARHLFGAGPYGHLPIGTLPAVAAISSADARAFHERVYRFDRAVLVAVGDDSHEALAEAASHAFSRHARPAARPPRGGRDPVPPPPAKRLVLVDRPGAPQSELRIGRIGPPRNTPDYHSLVTLNNLLGGQFVSRINLNLREDKGYTYGARTVFDFRAGPGPFVVQASVHREATAASVNEVLAEIAAVRGPRPPTPEEMDLARATLTRGYARSFETAEQLARAVTQLVVHDLPDDYYDRFVRDILAVDAEAVTAAARRWLSTDDLLTVIVGDTGRIADSVSALDVGVTTVERHGVETVAGN